MLPVGSLSEQRIGTLSYMLMRPVRQWDTIEVTKRRDKAVAWIPTGRQWKIKDGVPVWEDPQTS